MIRKSNEQLLEELRSLLLRAGRLSNSLISETPGMCEARTYWYRFGGLRRACQLIGYDLSKQGKKSDDELLTDLHSLLVSKGCLTSKIITNEGAGLSLSALKRRFGTLTRAFDHIGYDWRKDHPPFCDRSDERRHKSSEEMLTEMRKLLALKGCLTKAIIQDAAISGVSESQLKRRFGKLTRVYELIGYDWTLDHPSCSLPYCLERRREMP